MIRIPLNHASIARRRLFTLSTTAATNPRHITLRAISTTSSSLGEPHATTKSQSSLYPAVDPQSSNVTSGLREAKSESTSGFNAAKSNPKGGNGKDSSGSLKDQVGGQRGGMNAMKGKEESSPKGVLGKVIETVSSEKGSYVMGGDSKSTHRFLHTSVRRASSPPQPKSTPVPTEQAKLSSPKYVGAFSQDSTKSGYDIPPSGMPPNLESTYDSLPPPPEGVTPFSKAGYSSSAVDPPHPVLSQKAKDGDMPEKNPQPQPEMGEKGNFEAWKSRKI